MSLLSRIDCILSALFWYYFIIDDEKKLLTNISLLVEVATICEIIDVSQEYALKIREDIESSQSPLFVNKIN